MSFRYNFPIFKWSALHKARERNHRRQNKSFLSNYSYYNSGKKSKLRNSNDSILIIQTMLVLSRGRFWLGGGGSLLHWKYSIAKASFTLGIFQGGDNLLDKRDLVWTFKLAQCTSEMSVLVSWVILLEKPILNFPRHFDSVRVRLP